MEYQEITNLSGNTPYKVDLLDLQDLLLKN